MKYHRLRGFDTETHFLLGLEAASPRSRCQWGVGVWQGLSPWLADDRFLARSSHGIFSMPSGERPLVSLPLL